VLSEIFCGLLLNGMLDHIFGFGLSGVQISWDVSVTAELGFGNLCF
jgi:hypothetical protein